MTNESTIIPKQLVNLLAALGKHADEEELDKKLAPAVASGRLDREVFEEMEIEEKIYWVHTNL